MVVDKAGLQQMLDNHVCWQEKTRMSVRTYQSLTEFPFPYDYKPSEDDLAEWIQDSQLFNDVVVKDMTEPLRNAEGGWLVMDVGFEGTPR